MQDFDRGTGIGASEIAAAVGLSPYMTVEEFIQRKLGMLPPVEENWPMRWGKLQEPVIIAELREDHAWEITPNAVAMRHASESWAFATPDALADLGEELINIQCKTAQKKGDAWGPEGTDEVPAHYAAQVLFEMAVLRSRGHEINRTLVACRFSTRPVQKFWIPWDAERAEWLLSEGRAVWTRIEQLRKAAA